MAVDWGVAVLLRRLALGPVSGDIGDRSGALGALASMAAPSAEGRASAGSSPGAGLCTLERPLAGEALGWDRRGEAEGRRLDMRAGEAEGRPPLRTTLPAALRLIDVGVPRCGEHRAEEVEEEEDVAGRLTSPRRTAATPFFSSLYSFTRFRSILYSVSPALGLPSS